jgi:hypothetical protein
MELQLALLSETCQLGNVDMSTSCGSPPPPFMFQSPLGLINSIVVSKLEEKVKKREIYDINFFVQIKLPTLSLNDFKCHFRVEKSTFEVRIKVFVIQYNHASLIKFGFEYL